MTTLPFHTDPKSWIFITPITIGLIWLYFQPSSNVIKQIFHELMRSNLESWGNLLKTKVDYDHSIQKLGRRFIFASIIVMLGIGSLISFTVDVGIFNNPPHPKSHLYENINIDDYEIITNGHSAHAQLKPKPTNQDFDTTESDTQMKLTK